MVVTQTMMILSLSLVNLPSFYLLMNVFEFEANFCSVLNTGDFLFVRSVVFRWLNYILKIYNTFHRSQLFMPHLWRCLADVIDSGHPMIGSIHVAKSFGITGVASSWNSILRAFPSLPLAFQVNNDVFFVSNVIERTIACINIDQPQFLPLLHLNQQFSIFFITVVVWDYIGLFNPDFHPAYCEDLEYRDRLLPSFRIVWPYAQYLQAEIFAPNTQASTTIASDHRLMHYNLNINALNKIWWLSQLLFHCHRGTWFRLWFAEWAD